MNIIVTDCQYRSAVSLVQALGQNGHRVYCVQTNEMHRTAPAFASRYAAECTTLSCSVRDEDYPLQLMARCQKIGNETGQKPVLLPAGAGTVAILAANRASFDDVVYLCLPEKTVLAHANDKAYVHELAARIGVPVPQNYKTNGLPPCYPVIVKPVCGEQFGLKAKDRYLTCHNEPQLQAAIKQMAPYGETVVQQYVTGHGVGVCVVMDNAQNPAAILCHRRIREYPLSGGPSTCCESFFDDSLAAYATKLLRALNFTGIAMVEFRGDEAGGYSLLEINPRVWGSFPMTLQCGSRFAQIWAQAAEGTRFDRPDTEYQRGVRMRFLVNDSVAMLSLLLHGRWRDGFGALRDALSPSVREALHCPTDPKPRRQYLKNCLKRH